MYWLFYFLSLSVHAPTERGGSTQPRPDGVGRVDGARAGGGGRFALRIPAPPINDEAGLKELGFVSTNPLAQLLYREFLMPGVQPDMRRFVERVFGLVIKSGVTYTSIPQPCLLREPVGRRIEVFSPYCEATEVFASETQRSQNKPLKALVKRAIPMHLPPRSVQILTRPERCLRYKNDNDMFEAWRRELLARLECPSTQEATPITSELRLPIHHFSYGMFEACLVPYQHFAGFKILELAAGKCLYFACVRLSDKRWWLVYYEPTFEQRCQCMSDRGVSAVALAQMCVRAGKVVRFVESAQDVRAATPNDYFSIAAPAQSSR